MQFFAEQNALICRRQGETLRIEAWGRDALRVRATMEPVIRDKDWALTEPVEADAEIEITTEPHWVGDGHGTRVPSPPSAAGASGRW